MDEVRTLNDKTQGLYGDALEDKRLQLLSEIMRTKRNIIGIKRDIDKFKEPLSEAQATHKQCVIDYTEMHDVLRKHRIHIGTDDLHDAFSAYTGHKDRLIADLIDAYYDTSLPLENAISITQLPSDHNHRHSLYGTILFQYFEKRDINAANLVKIATKLLSEYYPDIDRKEFAETVMNAGINGHTFIQGTPQYKKSLQFAKIFKSIKGYKKKDFTNMYVKINSSWDAIEVTEPDNVEINDHNTEIVIEHTESKHNPNPPTQHNEANERHDIYEIGTQFYYWHSLRDHKHYIHPRYSDLKDEVLNNPVCGLDVSQWNSLQTECKTDINTDVARNIKSNGFWQNPYRIAKSTSLSMQHLAVLKIYTDFTTESKLYCATLRSGNPQRITSIAVWCRLLVECVQCYGTELDSKQTKYYRGVDSAFIFEKIATKFNLPMSTS
eukprot:823889_1